MSRHPLSDGPLPFGELAFGQVDYREFVCSKATFEWLRTGGMTHLDGCPVQLQMMDICVGGHNVVVRIWGETAAESETIAALELALVAA